MIKRIVTHDLWWLYWTQLWSSTSILPTLVRRRTYCVPCLQTNMAIWIWLAMVLEASRTGLNPAQNGVARVWGVLWCQNQFSRSSKLCSTAASNYWLDNSLRPGTHHLFHNLLYFLYFCIFFVFFCIFCIFDIFVFLHFCIFVCLFNNFKIFSFTFKHVIDSSNPSLTISWIVPAYHWSERCWWWWRSPGVNF